MPAIIKVSDISGLNDGHKLFSQSYSSVGKKLYASMTILYIKYYKVTEWRSNKYEVRAKVRFSLLLKDCQKPCS